MSVDGAVSSAFSPTPDNFLRFLPFIGAVWGFVLLHWFTISYLKFKNQQVTGCRNQTYMHFIVTDLRSTVCSIEFY